MTRKANKKAKKEQLTSTDKEAAHKLNAVFTFIEGKSNVNIQLSTLGFDNNPGKLVTYLCMGVALAGKDYKIPVDELTKSINDFYSVFVKSGSNNKEEK